MEILPIRVIANDSNVSAMVIDGNMCAAIAEMDMTKDDDEYWWLARLNVKPKYQKKGYGRLLVQKLKENARGIKILVAPGGYGTDPEVQFAFYRACGFVDQEDGTMILAT